MGQIEPLILNLSILSIPFLDNLIRVIIDVKTIACAFSQINFTPSLTFFLYH